MLNRRIDMGGNTMSDSILEYIEFDSKKIIPGCFFLYPQLSLYPIH